MQVVNAQISQIQKLNTNSRYYSSVHSQFVAEIAKTLPEPLKVCYLVNSGSEANDLALQIAMAARPGADHVAGAQSHLVTSCCKTTTSALMF